MRIPLNPTTRPESQASKNSTNPLQTPFSDSYPPMSFSTIKEAKGVRGTRGILLVSSHHYSRGTAINYELSKSRTDSARPSLVLFAVPRLSLLSINNAAVASWSRSLCGSNAGLVNVDPEAEVLLCV